jgi:hypothetical protein
VGEEKEEGRGKKRRGWDLNPQLLSETSCQSFFPFQRFSVFVFPHFLCARRSFSLRGLQARALPGYATTAFKKQVEFSDPIYTYYRALAERFGKETNGRGPT